MATLTLHTAYNMQTGNSSTGSWGLSGYAGQIFGSTADITASDGWSENWGGTFTFPFNAAYGANTPSGLITNLTVYSAGNQVFSASGLTMDAYSRFGQLNSHTDELGWQNYLKFADTITGSSGNDVLVGYGGNDTINAGLGVDTLIYSGTKDQYTISGSNGSYTVSGSSVTGDGSDSLTNVERLQFADKKFALDLTPDGNAAKALEFIGMLAHGLVSSSNVIGTILSIFDQGKSMKEVCQLAIDLGLTGQLAGSTSNLDLAKLVFRNVVGSEASAEAANGLAGFIQGNGGSMSQADFLTAIAGLELNNQHIGLVGLQSTGVEYII